MALSEQQLKQVAQRWLEAVNSGNVDVLDQLIASDVVDHSGLTEGHGGGREGYKQLVQQLRGTLPNYSGDLDSIDVNGDLVTIRHTGSAEYPQHFSALMGAPPQDPAMRQMQFNVTSVIRVNDNGQITEHWATEGPFGKKTAPESHPVPAPGRTGTADLNKAFMRQYVANVIDAMAPDNGRYYFAQNFYNHDPAPGEQPGLDGVIQFIGSIFSAFSGFSTSIDEQIAEDDLVVGRWSQTFTNTGPYLGFPASGKHIHIGGITITRVRDDHILEEWEARDALSLIGQMGIPSPLGPLDGNSTAVDADAGKEIARRFFYSVWDQGDLNAADQIFAPDFVNNLPIEGQAPGVDGVKQLVQAFRTGFPDCSISVDLQVAAGGHVASRYTFRGTHNGTFRGVAATGKRVEISGISIHAISNGKIAAHWGYFDDASLVFQLGLIQYPSQPGGPGWSPPPAAPPASAPTPQPTPSPTPQPAPSPTPQPAPSPTPTPAGPWGTSS
jgi:steroid delta-isomerase-like uncharacterized protein